MISDIGTRFILMDLVAVLHTTSLMATHRTRAVCGSNYCCTVCVCDNGHFVVERNTAKTVGIKIQRPQK